MPVRKYVADWIEERRRLDLDWENDRARLQHHVLPVIGDMKLADVRTRHIIDLFHRIRSNEERPVAQRTVYSIYSTVSALFRDAKLADKIEQTPCCLDERQLGPLVDKDPEWRATAIFTRDEVEELISHPAIPLDRRDRLRARVARRGSHRRGGGAAMAPLRSGEATARRAARRVRVQQAQEPGEDHEDPGASARPSSRDPRNASPVRVRRRAACSGSIGMSTSSRPA
jgi:hypothetical protein